ncbi:DNA replication/repair protein RecF [Luteimonas panaciterrae]|uniref:DNA replication/repair protein RecF n=1 Tax=Luteimonas panaciterrae TaxID=363885 RepID=UPI001CFA55E2|nr:DNA replication/repair protein RecF [Luteimonas panaciterrae]
MRLTRLDIRGLRRFDTITLALAPGLNLITGDNGAGKTSVLEAIHLLAYGRSFRGRVRDGLIRSGAPAVEVFAEWWEDAGARVRKVGLRHSGQAWEGRLDGASVGQLGELCAALAAVTFEPGSHALVSGGGEPRRRYLDWGLFHVEPAFLPHWRRYARALKQRNSLLKQRGTAGRRVGDAQLEAWDHEMAEAGEPLTRLRQRYLEQLQDALQPASTELAPELGLATLDFQPGWRREDMPLADALLLARDRDLAAGYTSVGPHRADWRVRHAALPNGETLSRGQAKLTALACTLAQAEHYVAQRGEWPVVLLDDLASELDQAHQGRVLQRLAAGAAQVIVTGTEIPASLARLGLETARFHVEQGQLLSS